MNFQRAVEIILDFEGGYVSDPADPGGETNFGISKRSYPDISIRNITRENAKDIYKRDYWDVLRIDEMPEPIRLLVFDAAVNQGKKAAITMLQGAVGVLQDGYINDLTLVALRESAIGGVFSNMATFRFNRYSQNFNWPTYGKGWSKRLLHAVLESVDII